MHPIYFHIKQSLADIYPEGESSALAKWIAIEVLGLTTVELYAGKDNKISTQKLRTLNDIIQRLKRYEPLQYILGETSFCGFPFSVNPDVLIPRPETEELVAWIVADHISKSSVSILDIGTGSGCIAISLARLLSGAAVSAYDVSPEALRIASANARLNDVKVGFRQVDILHVDVPLRQFDVIVSNPPYITLSEKPGMDHNVTDWEPELALFVPNDDPLLFYRTIARKAKNMLISGGNLYFEINQAYGDNTVQMMQNMGYADVELRKDINGNDRMVKGRLL